MRESWAPFAAAKRERERERERERWESQTGQVEGNSGAQRFPFEPPEPARGGRLNRGGLVNESTCPPPSPSSLSSSPFDEGGGAFGLHSDFNLEFSFPSFFSFCFFPSFFLPFFLSSFPSRPPFPVFFSCFLSPVRLAPAFPSSHNQPRSPFVEFRLKDDRKRRWACESEGRKRRCVGRGERVNPNSAASDEGLFVSQRTTLRSIKRIPRPRLSIEQTTYLSHAHGPKRNNRYLR